MELFCDHCYQVTYFHVLTTHVVGDRIIILAVCSVCDHPQTADMPKEWRP